MFKQLQLFCKLGTSWLSIMFDSCKVMTKTAVVQSLFLSIFDFRSKLYSVGNTSTGNEGKDQESSGTQMEFTKLLKIFLRSFLPQK